MNYIFQLKNFSLLLLLFLPFLSVAQDKMALIIGNNDYEGKLYNDLPTCINDAEEMGKCLEALGYTTTIIKNATRAEILNAFKSFDKRLKNDAEIGIFYYSGHAAYIEEDYCILPAKTEIDRNSLKNDCIDIKQIATCLKSKCKLSFLFFDACRNLEKVEENLLGVPDLPDTKGTTDGLVLMPPKKKNKTQNKQFICYATETGDVARSGGGGNLSPFTRVLTSHIFDKKGFAKIWNESIMIEVPALANGQTPKIDNTFDEDNVHFCFNKNGIESIYNKVGIRINVNPKSKIRFGDELYDSGKELLLSLGYTYKYTIEHIGYNTYSGTIYVNDKTPSNININLTPAPEAKFKVICDKPTKAKVFIDDIYKGVTPIIITTTSGIHDIKVVADRYKERNTKISLTPGENEPYKVMLTKKVPNWCKFDNYSGAHHLNYHYSPKYQWGLSYMHRFEDRRFSIGAMLAISTGSWKLLSTDEVSQKTSISLGNGYVNIGDDEAKQDDTKQDDANLLVLGNIGYNICNGIMLEAGLGVAGQQKLYKMPDKLYKGNDKWSPAIRLGAKFFIPIDNFENFSITLGGGYTYLPINHKYSSYDISIGACWHF